MTPRLPRRREPLGLSDADATRVEAEFGVLPAQVARDHVISHALAGLAGSELRDTLVFFGGTALTRTYLPSLRLSEDIDLITKTPRSRVAPVVARVFERALARPYGNVSWRPSLTATSGSQAAVMVVDERITVRVQVLSQEGYSFPTELRQIDRRYSDVPDIHLHTLTSDGFVVAKLSAWEDRRAPRDLYDLWALADAGLVTSHSLELYRRIGPTGGPPHPRVLDDVPDEKEWTAALAHQGLVRIGPQEAADTLRQVLASLASR